MSAENPGFDPTAKKDSIASPERFKGVPTEVPRREITMRVPRSQNFEPGIVGSNGGLIAAYDKDGTIHIAPQSDIKGFTDLGYKPGQAEVPLTGADQRGWHGGPMSRDLARMGVNELARLKGVKGRTVIGKDGNTSFTGSPFDEGEFIDMENKIEVSPNGQQIVGESAITEIAKGDERNVLKTVGTFNTNNHTLSWVTPDGAVQIAPDEPAKQTRLLELGYSYGEGNVPHSNGESFAPQQFGNPEAAFADMRQAVAVTAA